MPTTALNLIQPPQRGKSPSAHPPAPQQKDGDFERTLEQVKRRPAAGQPRSETPPAKSTSRRTPKESVSDQPNLELENRVGAEPSRETQPAPSNEADAPADVEPVDDAPPAEDQADAELTATDSADAALVVPVESTIDLDQAAPVESDATASAEQDPEAEPAAALSLGSKAVPLIDEESEEAAPDEMIMGKRLLAKPTRIDDGPLIGPRQPPPNGKFDAGNPAVVLPQSPAGVPADQPHGSTELGLSADADPNPALRGGDLEVPMKDAETASPQSGVSSKLETLSRSGSDTSSPTALPETAEVIEPMSSRGQPAGPAAKPAPAPVAQHVPEARFAEVNHPRIVSGIRQELLPNGGTMHLRLDPPELGAMQVTVRMLDGVMTATFQTGNDEAAKLLSHSLHQLKSVLESQGVSVDKLQVQQTPRDFDSSARNDGERSQGQLQYDQQARQEQQRRQLMARVWRRLSLGNDPLDLVA